MTANAMKADRDRCLDAGMNGFVTKPINPEELWQALLRWIKPRPGLGQQATPLPVTPQTVDPSVDALMQGLGTVPDLDVNLGLRRTNNNPAFYISLLKKFVAGQADVTQQILRSLGDADWPSAERMAHTLKGVAGNLGATALQASAEALETGLRNTIPIAQVQPRLEDASARLRQLILALQGVAGLFPAASSQVGGTLSAAERDAAEAIIQQLKSLVAEDDASAMELWESHAPALRALLPHAAQIEAAINAYDFEEALTLMEESA